MKISKIVNLENKGENIPSAMYNLFYIIFQSGT